MWEQEGALVDNQLTPGYPNGVDHWTWHPAGSLYVPQPGDVAVYGLETASDTVVHAAVLTSATGRTDADVEGNAAPLSGYVSPSPSPS